MPRRKIKSKQKRIWKQAFKREKTKKEWIEWCNREKNKTKVKEVYAEVKEKGAPEFK